MEHSLPIVCQLPQPPLQAVNRPLELQGVYVATVLPLVSMHDAPAKKAGS